MARIFGAVACSGCAPQSGPAFIEKVKRSRIQVEEFGHLTQGTMQRIGEIQRFRQSLADGIQHHEFAVASADFQFCLFALGNVLKKSLVGSGVSRRVAHGNGGLQHGARFAVFTAHFEFEIGHCAVFLQQLFEPLPIGRVLVEAGWNVNGQQLFAAVIAGHAQQGIVEVQEPALRCRNENAFLHVGNERAIFFFRSLAFRDVF